MDAICEHFLITIPGHVWPELRNDELEQLQHWTTIIDEYGTLEQAWFTLPWLRSPTTIQTRFAPKPVQILMRHKYPVSLEHIKAVIGIKDALVEAVKEIEDVKKTRDRMTTTDLVWSTRYQDMNCPICNGEAEYRHKVAISAKCKKHNNTMYFVDTKRQQLIISSFRRCYYDCRVGKPSAQRLLDFEDLVTVCWSIDKSRLASATRPYYYEVMDWIIKMHQTPVWTNIAAFTLVETLDDETFAYVVVTPPEPTGYPNIKLELKQMTDEENFPCGFVFHSMTHSVYEFTDKYKKNMRIYYPFVIIPDNDMNLKEDDFNRFKCLTDVFNDTEAQINHTAVFKGKNNTMNLCSHWPDTDRQCGHCTIPEDVGFDIHCLKIYK